MEGLGKAPRLGAPVSSTQPRQLSIIPFLTAMGQVTARLHQGRSAGPFPNPSTSPGLIALCRPGSPRSARTAPAALELLLIYASSGLILLLLCT